MNLLEVVNRPAAARPWAEGEKIPWHEPGFSRRMLAEHLSEEHDAASRRSAIIDRQVEWIHGDLLSARPARILDLCCGPGLYTSRLAKLGHECVGIDHSPASMAHAEEEAKRGNLRCTYLREDVRTAEYGSGLGLVMLIFGEYNTFRPSDARKILERACAALAEDGLILLEPHTFDAVKETGERPASWRSAQSGLFSERPHLCLEENSWDAGSRASTIRFFVVDAVTAEVTRHASSLQAYTDDEYRDTLRECGFDEVRFFASLTGDEDQSRADLIAIAGRKRAAAR